MKKLNYIIFLIICMLFTTNVFANSIEKITMDIYIDKNGDAHIKEEWTANLNSGTEGYKEYANLGTSEIKDYKVYMNGVVFYTTEFWDVDNSFDTKKYKAGLNDTDDGVELCFGITKYGTNTYKMEYTITDFVVSTTDKDMIYWTLIPEALSPKPEYVYIKIYSDFLYDYETPVWGYGNYGGYTYVHEDGYIELVQEDELDEDEYMVVLAEFPKGTFNTNVKLEENFNYYYEMAEDGATAYSDKFNFFEFIYKLFFGIVTIIFEFLPFIIVAIFSIKFSNSNSYGTKKLKFGKDAKKLKDVPYFRNIPLNKDIFKAYWVAGQYKLIKNKTDFLGAILLKWLKNKNIENIIVESQLLKKQEKSLKLLGTDGMTKHEIDLYDMMYAASNDGILEKNEFTKWCKKNYSKILNWFNKVIDEETMNFVNEGLITEDKKTFTTTYVVNDIMKQNAIEMAGLKKFLNEFSNIKDRGAIEVNLWEEYLMYAQIFGIAKKVAKEFKELYPDIITDEYYNDFVFIHTISYSGISAASSAKSRAESYSSGGGGFSSGGGGGGSFGGGGGGGFR